MVESDEISTIIIRHLTAEKGGRVTFIPLNRVRAPHIEYPHNPDVVPLVKKLIFRPEYASAFKQVSLMSGQLCGLHLDHMFGFYWKSELFGLLQYFTDSRMLRFHLPCARTANIAIF